MSRSGFHRVCSSRGSQLVQRLSGWSGVCPSTAQVETTPFRRMTFAYGERSPVATTAIEAAVVLR